MAAASSTVDFLASNSLRRPGAFTPLEDGGMIASANLAERLRPLQLRLQAFLRLEDNWDSYGAKPVHRANAEAAIRLLQSLVRANGPLPSLVPTVTGGVQIEWRAGGRALDLEIIAPSRFVMIFEDPSHDILEEEELGPDLAPFKAAFDRLVAA